MKTTVTLDMALARQVLRRVARRAGVRFTTRVTKQMDDAIGRFFWDPGSIYVYQDGAKLTFANRRRPSRAPTPHWESSLADPTVIDVNAGKILETFSPERRRSARKVRS